jgi:hypothetical protein
VRCIVPRGVHPTVLAPHGARVAVRNLEIIRVTAEDIARTMIYSLVDFNGLMDIQQNNVEAVRLVIEERGRLLGDAPLYDVCWNHLRIVKNRTSISTE